MIKNPKYKKNKKNGGNPPPVTNQGTYMIPVPCGNCIECKRQKANNWRIRLIEEFKTEKRGKFVTMTFSDESIKKLEEIVIEERRKKLEEAEEELNKEIPRKNQYLTGYELENEIAIKAVRMFSDRYKAKYKKRIKHWLVTELGQESTERIHIHGILYTETSLEEIRRLWSYGNINKKDKDWSQQYCNEMTIGYVVKYINKTDPVHKAYKPVILTTPGIGAGYINTLNAKNNKYNGENTQEYYLTRKGAKISLPTYYRNKLYTDEQKEQLWINKLNSKVKWVNKVKIQITAEKTEEDEDYKRQLDYARQENTKLGYGGITSKEAKKHEADKRKIRTANRLKRQRDEMRKKSNNDCNLE